MSQIHLLYIYGFVNVYLNQCSLYPLIRSIFVEKKNCGGGGGGGNDSHSNHQRQANNLELDQSSCIFSS